MRLGPLTIGVERHAWSLTRPMVTVGLWATGTEDEPTTSVYVALALGDGCTDPVLGVEVGLRDLPVAWNERSWRSP